MHLLDKSLRSENVPWRGALSYPMMVRSFEARRQGAFAVAGVSLCRILAWTIAKTTSKN